MIDEVNLRMRLTGIFDLSKTGFPGYYDNFLTESGNAYMEKSRNQTGSIQYMTPREYFNYCINDIFENSISFSELLMSRSDDLIPEYVEAMKQGNKFPLPYLDFGRKEQEGLHRMLAAAKIFGWDSKKFPVLCVYPKDIDLYMKQKLLNEARDYIRFDFDKAIDDGLKKCSDSSSNELPNDLSKIESCISECAYSYTDCNIDVDVSLKSEDAPYLVVRLTTFNGLDLNEYDFTSSKYWYVEDYFITDEEYSQQFEDEDTDEELMNVEDFFFM